MAGRGGSHHHRLAQRRPIGLAGDAGFTLIELLIVVVIIGVLLAIAVPSYLGMRQRAAESAAKANLRAAVSAAEAYYADSSTYVGMSAGALKVIDNGLSPTLSVASVATSSYCLTDSISGSTWSVRGPGANPMLMFNNATCT